MKEQWQNSGAGPTDYRRKIFTRPALQDHLQKLRAAPNPPQVVQCHGCFDIVHPGHIRYLQFAKSQGDILIVSITGDASIDKGSQRPYIPEELRAENLAALEFVNFVIIDPDETAELLLAQLRPDIYVKGHEYAASRDPRFLAERETVESYGGRVIFSSGQVVFSSSRLLESIENGSDLDGQRLWAVCRRHEITRGRLESLLTAMSRRRILVVGDTLIERYVLCDAGNIASESPMMSLHALGRRDYLGGAALVACQAAALGAQATLMTSLGEDAESQFIRETLRGKGVAVEEVRFRRDVPRKTRFIVDDHKVLKVHEGSPQPLDSAREGEALIRAAELRRTADAVILYDCGYGLMTPGLLEGLSLPRDDNSAFITAAANEPQGSLAGLQNSDLICTSERRLRAATQDMGSSLSTLAYALLDHAKAVRLLVTVGKRGLVTFDRRSHDRDSEDWGQRLRSEYLPSFADRVADRLGASECLLATATLGLAAGGSFMQSAYLAVASAGIVVAALGVAPVSVEALHVWLTQRREIRDTVKLLTTPARVPVQRQQEFSSLIGALTSNHESRNSQLVTRNS